MKIGELIELTKEEPLSKIAKERLDIGEKPAREALKKAGCYSLPGKKGWLFEGNPEILEKSVYDFSSTKPKANETTKTPKNKETKEHSNEITKEEKQQINNTTNEGKSKRKRASFDIDVDLLKQLKIRAVVEEKNLYDLVEQAIREFMEKK